MDRTQQRILKLNIKTLKNIKDLEISFEDNNVTAILGPNGCGKSTILHALASVYKPQESGENYRFSNFFLPNTDALWDNSSFDITHSFRKGKEVETRERLFKKTKARWTPRYDNRPVRDIYYIGIDKCVPMIEMEKKQARINYSTKIVSEGIVEKILDKASYILKKNYEILNEHTAGNKKFIGVVSEGLQYSAISMSAGEQKVFYILEKLFRAKKYSLILIDELDLLLHNLSFKKLVEVIIEEANKNNIQIIFTTHRESVIDFEGKINIRHIIEKEGKTLCFNETKPAAIDRLTGTCSKPIDVYVEDDFSEAIVRKISTQNKIGKFVSIIKYGSCENSFNLAVGLLLTKDYNKNTKIVLDGDRYTSEEEQREKIKKSLTGNDAVATSNREKALELLTMYNIPEKKAPEEYIHQVISKLDHIDNNDEFNEIIEEAKDINNVQDNHLYINEIIEKIGWEKVVGYSKVIDLFSSTPEWKEMTKPINDWLVEEKTKISE